jgi:predicted aldo/keto reductase-like oxidoreductase
MEKAASRRSFLAAGLAAPAMAYAPASPETPAKTPDPKLSSAPKLEYRKLGKTGLKVTTVAFGSMITSDGTVLERAADLGVNYFDTARGYQSGNCERMVGNSLKSRRKDLIISTKSKANDKAGLMSDLETSLRELQTDYVDIWYLHAKSSPSEVNDEMMETQAAAKKAGKIRFSGISTHSGHKELIPWVASKPHFDVLLTTYNFIMEQAMMDPLLETSAKAGLGIVAMKVMAGGRANPRRTNNDAKAKEILQRDGALLSALKWTLRNKHVHTTIPSMTDLDQLEENLKAMSSPWTNDDSAVLAARAAATGQLYCHYCGSCAGTCSKGLPVSDVLRYVMYADGYGQFALGREQFNLLPEELKAVRCSDCSGCTVQCPNGVRIVERLSLAQEYFA